MKIVFFFQTSLDTFLPCIHYIIDQIQVSRSLQCQKFKKPINFLILPNITLLDKEGFNDP